MRALTTDELNWVSGGTDEGSQLLGPSQLAPGFGGAGSDFLGGPSDFGGQLGGSFGWPFNCDLACQQRKREEEQRKREEAERRRQHELAMEQLRNNRINMCGRQGRGYRETSGTVAVKVDLSQSGGNVSVMVQAPTFECR